LFHKTLISLIFVSFLSASVFAADPDPLSMGIGARPLALGGAFVGLADDGSAIFTNPAGLSILKNNNFISMYSQPVTDVTFTCLGAALPNLLGGSIGIGYRARNTSDVAISSTEAANYAEQDISLTYSRNINETLSFGIGVRSIGRKLSPSTPSLAGANGSGTVFDLGIKNTSGAVLNFGLAHRGMGTIKYDDGDEVQPTRTSLGASLRIAGENSLYEETEQEITANLDLTKIAEEKAVRLSAGVEWYLVETLALRLGVDQAPASNISTDIDTFITSGFGLYVMGTTIDYAYRKVSAPSASPQHYFSIGYVGPREKKKREEDTILYPSPEPSHPTATKLERAAFKDLPADDPAKDPAELLATAGLVHGYSDGTFRPNIKLSRLHFSTLLLTAKNLSSKDPVREVGGEIWAGDPTKYVSRKEGSALMGIAEEVARPNDTMTRGEFAILLAKTPAGQAAIKRLPPLNN
jgi:hypothetical protein